MRKFKKGRALCPCNGGGKKKTMSRKKLTLKAQAAVEKGREATFMSKLFPGGGRQRSRRSCRTSASYKEQGGACLTSVVRHVDATH